MKQKIINNISFIAKNKQEAKDGIENKLKDSDFPIIIKGQKPDSYKSDNQNKTFHDLLDEFWKSGQSSFKTYEEMRNYYKEIGGLIEKLKFLFSEKLKEWIWYGVKIGIKKGEITQDEQIKFVDFINGEVIKEKSWSTITKKKATFTIDTLIKEMIESGVNNKEFNKTIDNLTKENELFKKFINEEYQAEIINYYDK